MIWDSVFGHCCRSGITHLKVNGVTIDLPTTKFDLYFSFSSFGVLDNILVMSPVIQPYSLGRVLVILLFWENLFCTI